MLHPRSVITHNIDVLQTGQHFHFSEDLNQQIKPWIESVYIPNWKKTAEPYLHAVVPWGFFNEDFFHSIKLSIQLILYLWDDATHNMAVIIN